MIYGKTIRKKAVNQGLMKLDVKEKQKWKK